MQCEDSIECSIIVTIVYRNIETNTKSCMLDTCWLGSVVKNTDSVKHRCNMVEPSITDMYGQCHRDPVSRMEGKRSCVDRSSQIILSLLLRYYLLL